MSDDPDGQFPRGKISESDEGRLEMRMQVIRNTLIIHFGKPTVWIGLGLPDVKGLVQVLQANIEIMERQAS